MSKLEVDGPETWMDICMRKSKSGLPPLWLSKQGLEAADYYSDRGEAKINEERRIWLQEEWIPWVHDKRRELGPEKVAALDSAADELKRKVIEEAKKYRESLKNKKLDPQVFLRRARAVRANTRAFFEAPLHEDPSKKKKKKMKLRWVPKDKSATTDGTDVPEATEVTADEKAVDVENVATTDD